MATRTAQAQGQHNRLAEANGAAPTAAATVPRRTRWPASAAQSDDARNGWQAALPVDGDWAKWAEPPGSRQQIVSLPIIGWGHTYPPNLLQTFNAGTSIGAVAYDSKILYVYFLTTDNTPHFDAPSTGANMFEYDGIELWLEEEQFGLGFNDRGSRGSSNIAITTARGGMARPITRCPTTIWGVSWRALAEHPFGTAAGLAVGASLEGKPGYVLMAKIPFEEINLVGGIVGRKVARFCP